MSNGRYKKTLPKGIRFKARCRKIPDSKVHGANMGPTWVLPAPDGPHVGPMNLVIRDETNFSAFLVILRNLKFYWALVIIAEIIPGLKRVWTGRTSEAQEPQKNRRGHEYTTSSRLYQRQHMPQCLVCHQCGNILLQGSHMRIDASQITCNSTVFPTSCSSWHQISALLAFCEGNPPVIAIYPLTKGQ